MNVVANVRHCLSAIVKQAIKTGYKAKSMQGLMIKQIKELAKTSDRFVGSKHFMHLSVVCPTPSLLGKGGADWGLHLINCEIPHPRGKLTFQIPTPPPGLEVGLSACKMKIAVVYMYSTDYNAFHTKK